MQLKVGDRFADQTLRFVLNLGRTQHPVGNVNGRLGNPVHVDQLRLTVTMSLDPALQAAEFERFAAKDHVPQTQLVLRV